MFYFVLQLVENSLLKLDSICRQANVMLVAARSYGLTGLVRISLKVFLFSVSTLLIPNGQARTSSCKLDSKNAILVN